MPLLIKNVGATFYGGYALLISTFGFIFGISSLGSGFKINRYLPSTQDLKKRKEIFYTAFYFNFFSILILSVVFTLFSGLFKQIFFKNSLEFTSSIIILALSGNLIHHYFTNYFRYTHRLVHYAAAAVIVPYLFILIVLFLVWKDKPITLNLLVISNFVSIIIPGCILIFLTAKEIGIWVKPNFKLLAEDIKVGSPLALNYVFDFVLSAGDRYVISYFLSITAVAHYNPAYTLGSFIILVPKVLSAAVQPQLAKAFDGGDIETVRKLMLYSLKLFIWLVLPFIAATALVSKPILELLANKEIASAANIITPVVSLGSLFYGLNLIQGFLLFLNLKTKEIFYVNVFSAFLNVILNIIFISIFKNIIVAAFTTLACYMITFFYIRSLIKKYITLDLSEIKFYVLKLVPVIAVWSVLLYYLNSGFQLNILIKVLIGFVLYLIMSVISGVVNVKEFKIIKK